jgi:ectoine hydroxylase-related dioxygenase (phytanoyl-CoA dioxygenase family)
VDDLDLEHHLEAIETDGFTIIEDVFSKRRASMFKKRIREIEQTSLRPLADGETEADSSFYRTTGLLRADPMFWKVPIDPTVTQVLTRVLGEDYLLSTFSGIDLKPHSGTVQPLHPDDALVGVPRPHERPIGATVMWVITDFNEGTGGTRLLPGSHREPLDLLFSQDSERMKQTVQPAMKPGTVLIFDHAIFHGASDNPSDDWRLGLQVSYHAGWVRPYTNWFRTIPVEEVREYPEQLQDLLGYKTYHGIGSAYETEPCSYRESYSGKGRVRPKRLSLV